ncbi:MAG: hypothetical protein K0R51_978 [Cytophagaceae bacterium]|jgi:hypothetical protein|nr:hypothetical protein [Cytophagaceae bacterium]
MEPIDKNTLLEQLEEKTEAHVQEVIALFQNLPAEVLLRPSATGGWSMAQCLEHLNSYGHYYLPRISKGIEHYSGAPNENFKSSWLGAYFIRIMDPKTSKSKYKAFKDHQPSPSLDAHAVVAEFIRQQETLLLQLRRAKTVDLNKIRIPISIMKWLRLKLGDVFQFIIAHNERHLQQAKKNREQKAEN